MDTDGEKLLMPLVIYPRLSITKVIKYKQHKMDKLEFFMSEFPDSLNINSQPK